MNEAPQALSVMEGIDARLPTIDDVKLLATFSRAYVANGQSAAAQTMLQRGSSLAGFDTRSLLTIADLQQDAGDLKGAAWSLQRAVEGDPSFLPARIKLGEFAVAQGDLPKASEVAEGLQRDFPDKPYGHHLLGTLRQKEGDDHGALEHLRAALALDDAPGLAVRVFAAERRVNGDAAGIEFLRGWLDRHPGDPLASLALAEGYSGVRDWKKAQALYEDAIAKAPDNPMLLNNLALAYLGQGDPRALELARRAQAAMLGSTEIGDTLGWVMVRSGNAAEGLKYLRDAESRTGSTPGLLYHIAYALSELGRPGEALAELERATASSQPFTDREDALVLRARLEQAAGKKPKGKEAKPR